MFVETSRESETIYSTCKWVDDDDDHNRLLRLPYDK